MKKPPVILSTSINSGTTLLGPVLDYILDKHGYYHKRMLPHYRVIPHKNFFKDMNRNEFTYQHYNIKTLETILGNSEYRIIFLVRDPRDVMVSYFKHQSKYQGPNITSFMKAFRGFLASEKMNDRDAINLLVTSNGLTFNYVGKKWYATSPGSLYRLISPWVEELKKDNCMIVKFEDLTSDMFNTVKSITDYIGVNVSMEDIETGCYARDVFLKEGRKRGAEQEHSFYRNGATGQWRKYFTDESLNTFKDVMGDMLGELGYV